MCGRNNMVKRRELDTVPRCRVLSSLRREYKAERQLRVEQLRRRNLANKDRLPPIIDLNSSLLFCYDDGSSARVESPTNRARGNKKDNHCYDDEFAGKWRWTPPVHLALFHREKDVVESLLRQGANPNLTDRYGQTALHVLCWSLDDDDEFARKFFEIVAETGDHRVRLDLPADNGYTALHWAVLCKHLRVAKLLLDKGADPNVANDAGFTPLNWICRHHDYQGVKRFFEIADETRWPLRVDKADSWGWTPLHYAVYRRDLDTAELLLRRGADANAINWLEETPLHVLCKYLNDDDEADVVERFFEVVEATRQKVQLKVVDRGCLFTPLDWAVFCEHDKVARVILSRGASTNMVAEFGWEPYLVETIESRWQRNFEIILIFLAIVFAIFSYLTIIL